jgi:DNA-binding NtrC family response regulator
MQLHTPVRTVPHPEFVQASIEDRVESLRSVAMLLLKEVESLQESAARDAVGLSEEGFSLADQIERYEKDMIRCALLRAKGRQNRAARLLGMKITTLNSKIKKYRIDWRAMDIQGAQVLQ